MKMLAGAERTIEATGGGERCFRFEIGSKADLVDAEGDTSSSSRCSLLGDQSA